MGGVVHGAAVAEPARFECVITDHHMPRMSGVELVRHLRDFGYRGRIVVISSELGPATDARYHALAVDLLLKKPVKFNLLPGLLAGLPATTTGS
ncbi:MAG: response regulator [Cephaloticoccus sp.]